MQSQIILPSDLSNNAESIEIISDEQSLLEVKDETSSGAAKSKITSTTITNLIADFDRFTALPTKIGRLSLPVTFVSLGCLIPSVYFFIKDDMPGLIFLMALSGVLTLASSVAGFTYHCTSGHNWFTELVNYASASYQAKRTEALNLIKIYNIQLRDDTNPLEIKSTLKRIKKEIEQNDKNAPAQRLAFLISAGPSLFKAPNIGLKGSKPGTAGNVICKEIFELAGLAKR
jgi:hypothetical protein